jgi:hypothetical protein
VEAAAYITPVQPLNLSNQEDHDHIEDEESVSGDTNASNGDHNLPDMSQYMHHDIEITVM